MLLMRRLRYALVALAIVVIAWLLWLARGAFVPFMLGGALAFLLSPLVERVARGMPFYRRHQDMARTLAILLVYLTGGVLIFAAAAAVIPPMIDEASNLIDNAPQYVEQAREQTERWTALYRERVPLEFQQRVDEAVARLGEQLGSYGQAIANRTFGIVTNTFNIVLGYIVIPFWLFYVLKDRHKIGPTIKGWFPPALRPDVDECIRIFQRVLGSYIRAQLTLGLFIGVITTVGLFLLDIQGYFILGLIAGLTEMVPVIGPILGAIPALIVTLATDPGKFWWVLLFYIAVQQIENAVLVPRVQGKATEIHPAVIIVLLVAAQQLLGFFGMIIAVPLAAVSKDLFRYVYRRLREREQELARPAVLRLERGHIRQVIGDRSQVTGEEPGPAISDL